MIPSPFHKGFAMHLTFLEIASPFPNATNGMGIFAYLEDHLIWEVFNNHGPMVSKSPK